MNPQLVNILDVFPSLHVLVIGEAMLDRYFEGQVAGICREAPVPTVRLDWRRDAPGGAANTAVNLRRLGAKVSFLSIVGSDLEGDRLRALLAENDVATEWVLNDANRTTIAKNRVSADSQLLVRFDQGSLDPITAAAEAVLVQALTELYPRVDAVVVSDYACGLMTQRLIACLTQLQAANPRILAVDAKRLPAYRAAGATVVKPNYQETLRVLDIPAADCVRGRAAVLARQGHRILDLMNAQLAAVTLDCEGALLFERGAPPYRTYGRPASAARAAGAGDTFVSALTLALAARAHAPDAAELAAAAAGLVVAQDGTVSCSQRLLREYLSLSDKVIRDPERLQGRADFYRQQGRRMVFTNGCFDILHPGHIAYLNHAKELGDVLIVGVNSDASVRRLKGVDRPINVLEDRLQVLTGLSCVDHVVPFNEDTASGLIQLIRPDVFVKGGDYHGYTDEALPEARLVQALGGRVEILQYIEDRSTTNLIERIRKLSAPPVVSAPSSQGMSNGSPLEPHTQPVVP